MKITISKNDFKRGPEKKLKGKKELLHEKTASSQAKNYIRRDNTYRLEEKKKEKPTLTNFAFLMYFLFVVGVAILVAGAWKLVITYSQNSFDTSSYAVLVKEESSSYVVALNKSTEAVSVVNIASQGEGRLKSAFSSQVPIDAMIVVNGDVSPLDVFSYSRVFGYATRISNLRLRELTVFDYIKMVLSISGIDNKNKTEVKFAFENGDWSLSQEELFDIFKDADIIHEGLGIEIINATETNGFAGSVASILEPIGVNIVSLSSEEKAANSSIKVRATSKTAKRISHILEIPIVQEEPSSIADITIVLGEDFEKKIQ